MKFKIYLAIPNGSYSLLGVVLNNGGLVDENVLLGVVPVDKTISGLDIEPLNGAGDLGGDDLLFDGVVLVAVGVGVIAPSLLMM